jgi:uncharacterized cupin superfamily protein
MAEAPLEETGHGLTATGPGWFVLNASESMGRSRGPGNGWVDFEPDAAPFDEYGINIHVIEPGVANCLYHEESTQEDFLVLAGECVLVIEEQERPLRQWDFVHCPAGTRHVFVGAGDGPCAILMVGARREGATVHYPVSEVAARHGASAVRATDQSREAYPEAGWTTSQPARVEWPPRGA